MIVCIVICAVVSAILFFPFTLWIDASGDKEGIRVCTRIFWKKLFKFNKTFGKKDSDDSGEDDSLTENAPEKPAEKMNTAEVFEARDEKVSGFGQGDPALSEEEKKEKRKKRKLTSRESWTILLTPEFDAQALWAAKNLISRLFKLFQIKFYNCFVEGIHMDYAKMGQLAALNGMIQSYPYIGAWDFRMDWTGEVEPHGECHVRIRLNICRIIGFVLSVIFYGGITAFRYWRRRARVLKTGELPELGFVRGKIVKFLAEDKD